MSKAVLISIRPKWCDLIASGQKTVEVRKTRPQLTIPFKVYVYCSKGKDKLITIIRDGDENYGDVYHGKDIFVKGAESGFYYGNHGKVIGEFICDAISPITFDRAGIPTLHYLGIAKNWTTCLTVQEAIKYCGDTEKHGLFGWHISDLVIYDKPKELGEFRSWNTGVVFEGGYPMPTHKTKRPPQSWCYVEDLT